MFENKTLRNELTSLEIKILVDELSFLERGKIDKVYHDKTLLTLQIHVPGRGKQLLNFFLPKYFFLSEVKFDFPVQPSGFALFLRKRLSQARINRIYQKDFERIVIFELLTKDEVYNFVVELFGRGNICLTDKTFKIIGSLSRENTTREFKKDFDYVFPDSRFNPFTDDIEKLCLEDNAVKAFATDFSMGGLYSEDLFSILQINRSKPSKQEVQELKTYLKSIKTKPTLYYDEKTIEFSIIPIKKYETKNKKEYESFQELLKEIIPQTIQPEKKDIQKEKKEKIVSAQQKQLEKIAQSIKENTKKAELLYQYHNEITNLINDFNKYKKKIPEVELIKQLQKKYPFLKQINFKTKELTLDLE